MNAIYQNMLSAYDLTTEQQQRNATFEVSQQVILSGLYNAGFFNVAAFYKKVNIPSQFKSDYPDATFSVINRTNFLDFVETGNAVSDRY